ncbi:hypothetical protein Cantr_05465 [Candida viswanathii]|uniref:Cell wall protein RHD3 n=1 Tax=Candida viswanathii TaxID=5486 RepID=A0A367XTI6_9ASCO|nr:hypothetical protein Cantr_05477 [Candida viswanathii]RCK56677.1 hypothetical protein Cantr_05465 [Candida viswanathii]
MFKVAVVLTAFLSFFFQSAFAIPIQDGYRGNVTLYVKSDNSDIDGQTLYTVDNQVGFNRLFIGDYVDPKSTFYLVKSYIYQELTGSSTTYAVTYNNEGYLGVAGGSDGIYISDFDASTGKLQFSGDQFLYAVHVVDNPKGYSASQYAIQVHNPTTAPENSIKIELYGRLNWAVL